MKKQKRQLRKSIKLLMCGALIVACFFCIKDVYAEYNPFQSIVDENDESKEVKFSALDKTFYDAKNHPVTDNTFLITTNHIQHNVRSDSKGVLYKGWYEYDGHIYYYDKKGYLLKDSQVINGTYYYIHEDGSVFNNEWDDDQWFTNGIVDGRDDDTLVFVEGETGFYYLDSNNEGRKVVNDIRYLNDGREVRFDENGHIVQDEFNDGQEYYYPVNEAKEINSSTYSVRLNEYLGTTDRDIKLINHRGYHSVSPENTLSAYKKSEEAKYQYVEVDVQLTSDNVPVLLHNGTLLAMAGVDVAINSITLEEAKTYSLQGEQITTLEEFISYCKANQITPYIELKSETISTKEHIKYIYDVVNKYDMIGKVEWISFSPTLLNYIFEYDTEDPIGYVVGKTDNYQSVINQAEAMKEMGMNVFIDSHYYNVNGLLQGCKEYRIPLEVWTVNDASIIESLDSYVSGVTTDTITYEE